MVLKIWCLPDGLTEEELKSLFQQILAVVKDIPELCVRSAKDATILFPADRMKWGLGEDIVAEVGDLPRSLSLGTSDCWAVRLALGLRLGTMLKECFPSAYVKCIIENSDLRTVVWTSGRSKK